MVPPLIAFNFIERTSTGSNNKMTTNETAASPSLILYDRLFLFWSLAVFAAYLFSCQFLAPRMSAYFIPAYSRLSRDERIRWNIVGSSKVFFFSIFCPANVYGFISDNGLVKDLPGEPRIRVHFFLVWLLGIWWRTLWFCFASFLLSLK